LVIDEALVRRDPQANTAGWSNVPRHSPFAGTATDHVVIITDDQRRIICINDAFISLREACRQIAEWRDAGSTCLPVLETPDLQRWLANRKRTSPRLPASGSATNGCLHRLQRQPSA
jgi:hypothetical protein